MALYEYVRYGEGNEKWTVRDVKDADKDTRSPMFCTILKFDVDPAITAESGQSVAKTVRYYGPMHFDLDNNEDIGSTLEQGRTLITKLHEDFGIDKKYIHCWLSGKKGIHVVVSQYLFGLKNPAKLLPWAYKYIAEHFRKQYNLQDIDMRVYSMGCGRMWRNENVKRKCGTYKVPVTFEEMMHMTAEKCAEAVQTKRPDFQRVEPTSSEVSPRASGLLHLAREHAAKVQKAREKAESQVVADFATLPEVPGCIHKLITEGDCGDSNYNQAAMQLAAWIAARFDRDKDREVYERDLIEPFLANVQSHSRSNRKQKLAHVTEQLGRAFSGSIKFSMGALVSTLGQPCGHCELCTAQRKTAEQTANSMEVNGTAQHTDKNTGVVERSTGWYRMAAGQEYQVTTFYFVPTSVLHRLQKNEFGIDVLSPRIGTIGTLIDDRGVKFEDVEVVEQAWDSRGVMNEVIRGMGTCKLLREPDLALVHRAMLRFYPLEDLPMTTYSPACGLYLQRTPNGAVRPHFIDLPYSITTGGRVSQIKYLNNAERCVPYIVDHEELRDNDVEVLSCLDAISKMNEPHLMAILVGWMASNHLREHINFNNREYPSVNVCGNAGSGKSVTTRMLALISGIDYNRDGLSTLNMENTTKQPLQQYVSSSTTICRIIEEFNESQIRNQYFLAGVSVIKAAWDRTATARGLPMNDRNGRGISEHLPMSAPVLYISEQRQTKPALQERSLSVLLTKMGRAAPGCREAFQTAQKTSQSLLRLARSLITDALEEDPSKYTKQYIEDTYSSCVPAALDDRPRYAYEVVFLGLDFLANALNKRGMSRGVETVESMKNSLLNYLSDNSVSISRDKGRDEVDTFLMQLNTLAADPTSHQGLKCGLHYQRIGDSLHLDLNQCYIKYRMFCSMVGSNSPFVSSQPLIELLEGEPYFVRKQINEDNNATMHVISVKACEEKGVELRSFREDAV